MAPDEGFPSLGIGNADGAVMGDLRSQPKLSETRQHTPTPWEAQEFDPEDKCVPIIGLRAECPDGPTNGMVAIATLFPTEMDAIDGIGPELAIANAAFIVDAVNFHVSLKARMEEAERAVDVLESNARVQAKLLADTGRRAQKLEGALRDSLTENAWNAYYCGVTRAGGKWMDGGRSEGEWLRRELDLGDGWHACAEIQRRIPDVVEKQIAALSAPAGNGEVEK